MSHLITLVRMRVYWICRHERGFAVQTLSRFAIAYLFTIKDGLRKGARVITVANTGVNLANLEVDDLSLKRRAAKGRAKAGLFMDQSFRDSSVLDAFHWVRSSVILLVDLADTAQELNERFPDFQYYNLHPGTRSLYYLPPCLRLYRFGEE